LPKGINGYHWSKPLEQATGASHWSKPLEQATGASHWSKRLSDAKKNASLRLPPSVFIKRRNKIGKPTPTCFIDFRKAYDLVCHKALLSKLHRKGMPQNIFRIVRTLYTNPVSAVRNRKGNTSSLFEYKRGVRQGCSASPVLFNLFINDILDNLSDQAIEIPNATLKVAGLLFADDLVLLAEDMNALQRSVTCVENWATRNEMQAPRKSAGV
jgi:hypothetical protein